MIHTAANPHGSDADRDPRPGDARGRLDTDLGQVEHHGCPLHDHSDEPGIGPNLRRPNDLGAAKLTGRDDRVQKEMGLLQARWYSRLVVADARRARLAEMTRRTPYAASWSCTAAARRLAAASGSSR
ncbi:MAG: hypothetical protein IH830_13315 [Planctomycetes bacterium]|nr:hypothetical protein [Planctomycetota bacterium]